MALSSRIERAKTLEGIELADFRAATLAPFAGTENDLSLPTGASIVKVSADANFVTRTVTGFVADPGRLVRVLFTGPANSSLDFAAENGGSVADNRILVGGGLVFATLTADGNATFWYDVDVSRWRVMNLRNP